MTADAEVRAIAVELATRHRGLLDRLAREFDALASESDTPAAEFDARATPSPGDRTTG